jgi:hypothetical protein
MYYTLCIFAAVVPWNSPLTTKNFNFFDGQFHRVSGENAAVTEDTLDSVGNDVQNLNAVVTRSNGLSRAQGDSERMARKLAIARTEM